MSEPEAENEMNTVRGIFSVILLTTAVVFSLSSNVYEREIYICTTTWECQEQSIQIDCEGEEGENSCTCTGEVASDSCDQSAYCDKIVAYNDVATDDAGEAFPADLVDAAERCCAADLTGECTLSFEIKKRSEAGGTTE